MAPLRRHIAHCLSILIDINHAVEYVEHIVFLLSGEVMHHNSCHTSWSKVAELPFLILAGKVHLYRTCTWVKRHIEEVHQLSHEGEFLGWCM